MQQELTLILHSKSINTYVQFLYFDLKIAILMDFTPIEFNSLLISKHSY